MVGPNAIDLVQYRENRDRGMSEQATDEHGLDEQGTDGLLAASPTLADDREPDASDPAFEVAIACEDFEHRRLLNSTRQRLFGRGSAVKIGRYRVERRLGVGGMGEVYLAHDDALDRKVAIKRVRTSSSSLRDQERLRREAKALARLSHPNVVQVYEVGQHEGRTFVAMEYVDGQTLGEWLLEAQRPWRAVLDRFLAAGRGLAGAHEAGLIHRDFKPDNVLLSADGRVLVADFGLALAPEDHRPAPESEPDKLAPRVEPSARLSTTGSILGTIRYMSLEQLLGRSVDARSDQFSFCVALYEALWGAPPYSLASSLAHVHALEHDEPRPPKSRPGQRVPKRLWWVIRRGLSKDPGARWPDMDSLLAALDEIGRRRVRRAWLGAAIAVSGALVGGFVFGADEPSVDPCAAVERELDGTWSADLRGELEAKLRSLDAGHAADSLLRVVGGLDRWSTGWVAQREAVCRSVEQRQLEPELGRLQNTCLTRQRQRVEDLVALLLEPQTGSDELARAVEAVAELPQAAACEDELALLGLEPPPPGIHEQVEELRREIGRAHELRLLGRVEEALTLAAQAEAAAAELGYGPVHAEALAELAKGEFEGGSLADAAARMQDAIDAAELHRHDYLAADLWTELTLRELIDFHDAEEGARLLRRANVSNGRVNGSDRLWGRLAFARGQLAELRGASSEAERAYRDALTFEVSGSNRSSYLSNLANVVGRRDPDAGVSLHREAVEAAELHFGPRHSQTADVLYGLATAIKRQDPDSPEFAAVLIRAVEIWRDFHTRDSEKLAHSELALGVLALERGDFDAAEAHALSLATIQAAILPPGHIDRSYPAQLLAPIYASRGEHEQALLHLRELLAIVEPFEGMQSSIVQRAHNDAASALLALGRLDEASAELDLLLPYVQGQPEHVPVRLRRCELALRRGQLDDADAELAVVESLELDDLDGHEFSYALLRALIDLRRGQFGPAAQASVQEAHKATPFSEEQIRSWLTQLGLSATERATLKLD